MRLRFQAELRRQVSMREDPRYERTHSRAAAHYTNHMDTRSVDFLNWMCQQYSVRVVCLLMPNPTIINCSLCARLASWEHTLDAHSTHALFVKTHEHCHSVFRTQHIHT
jgi:hypothetical protein